MLALLYLGNKTKEGWILCRFAFVEA